MHITRLRRHLGAFLVALAGLTLSGTALADPPSRVARLADVTGAISFAPGGDSDWIRATPNRPLITGDRLWVDAAARGELQLGGVAIRMGPQTSMALLNVDDRMAQLRLSQGSLNIRVWQLAGNEVVEIDTPNLALSIRRPGSYRVDVDANGESTAVTVHTGQAEVFGDGRAFAIGQGQGWRFFDSGLRDYDSFALAAPDDFDRWSSARDRRSERSASARYVPRELIGYEDLDDYGSWRDVAGYGHVWTPARVSADWAPYRDGHWAWVQPWGWTWVDDAPWGFAPSHYGRWANIGGRWGWIPGPATVRPVYAPALVAFVGASALNLNLGSGGAVAWFALGPREVYRPSYQVSREYFNRVNTSNAVVNTVQVNNFYNNSNTATVIYANRQVPGAVVAVPAATFVQSRPIAREAVRVSRETAVAAPVAAAAPSAPVRGSAAGPAGARPPETALKRPVFARSAPPALAATAPAATAQAPAPVTLVKPPQSAPTAPPPRRADAGSPQRQRPAPTPAAPAAAHAPVSAVPAAPAAAPTPAPAPAPRPAPAREREPAAVEPTRPAAPPPAAAAPRNEARPREEQERLRPRTPAARPEATRPEAARPEAARPEAARPAVASPPPAPPVPAPPAARPQPQPERAGRAPAPIERAAEPPAARPAPPAARPQAPPAPPPHPAPAAVPPPPPAAPAPAAAPPEQRARGPHNQPPKAAERREAASDAGKADEQPGRGPEGRGKR
jgi:hypothetical protein